MPSDSAGIYLTDGGLETTLIFLKGFDLPCFASFDLLKDAAGNKALTDYYESYLNIARDHQLGFILESPTWRANPDWVEKAGYPRSSTAEINKNAAQLMVDLKNEFAPKMGPLIVSGCVGPRGDGYQPDTNMSPEAARDYHSEQIAAFAEVPVEMVSAITMTNVEEAVGISNAASDVGIPSVISFTVETDGTLPSGVSLGDAIESVDAASTTPPIYYMINCAHPAHFADKMLDGKDAAWVGRIQGLRANASRKSHAELDESTELDRGDLEEFAVEHRRLMDLFPKLNVFGGCCGTDEEHVLRLARELS